MTFATAQGAPLPTLPNVVKQLAIRQVHQQHPAWPARLVLSVATRTLENVK